MTGPSAASAGGTRVVLPAPGAAVNTRALRSRITRKDVRNESIDRKRDHSRSAAA